MADAWPASTVHLARAGQEAVLAAIARRTFIDAFGPLYSARDLQAFLDKEHTPDRYAALLSEPQTALWLARLPGGEPVGYACAGPCALPAPGMPPRSGEVKRLYIAADHQGGGHGSALLDEVLRWLEARFAHLYIGVYADNAGAQRLYARRGFKKIAEYHFMVGEHADREWIMAR